MLTVLIVDDDASIRKLLDFALKKEGLEVLTARDGNEAFVMATANPPDVAILDVMMPGLHGYELCRRLRANPATAKIKIIFLTARSQPYDEKAGLDAGADLFLAKPVMPNELVEHIRTLAAQGASAPEAQQAPTETAPQSASVRPSGRLVACFNLAAQVGVTTLAINLALAFALARRAATPLIELHQAPAGLLAAMGLAPTANAPSRQETRPSWEAVAPHLVEHSTGVHILPASPTEAHSSPEWTRQAILHLQDHFPLSVVDVTNKPTPPIQAMLSMADLALLVTTPQVPAIRHTLRALEGLHALKFPDTHILLVVNNVHAAAQVPIDKIQQGMKRQVFAVIPHMPNMPDMMRAGRPLLLTEPGSNAAKAIGRMAMKIARGFQLA